MLIIDNQPGVAVIELVYDFIGHKTIVHGNRNGAGYLDRKIYFNEFRTVVKHEGDFVVLFDAGFDQGIGQLEHAIGQFFPGDPFVSVHNRFPSGIMKGVTAQGVGDDVG